MILIISSYCKKGIKLPETFNQLTAKQLLRIISIRESEGNLLRKQLQILSVLLNMNLIKFALLSNEFKNFLLPYTEKFLSETENKLTKNLFFYYKGLYGVKDRMFNLRMAEFHATEINYKRIIDGDEAAVNDLIAVLYRKPKKHYHLAEDKDGDIREPYNGNTVAYRSRIIANWNRHVKIAILMFYDACRQQIIKQHPVVFKKGNDDDEFSTEQQFLGMFLMMRGLAADGKYGDMDKIEDLYVLTALNEMTQKILEQKELEEKINMN